VNYQETLDYLYAQLPMFHRVGAQAYKPSLDNTLKLSEALGNPHKQFKSIHIAGTNGKGSTSHMMASICQAAGYKTALYTSPHLVDFRERIRINEEMIPQENVVTFVEKNKSIIEEIQPSFFEMCVVMAFDYFAKEKVDIAVIEVGMGGRLDSTNIIHPLLSIITNISFDHMQFLGDTLPKIATEKAGIIKEQTPVIISQKQDECADVFIEIANQKNAKIIFASDKFKVEDLQDSDLNLLSMDVQANRKNYHLETTLTGKYQLKNILGVVAAYEELNANGFNITEEALIEGVLKVKENTGLRGRWEILSKEPLTIADTGHNEDGIQQIINQISSIDYDRLHWVWGMVNDKEPSKVFKLLPKNANYYFCSPNIPRGLDSELCKEKAAEYELYGESFDSVAHAYEAAISNARSNDLILIGGSTFVVAEVL
jgi:dihydrofolate synthase/folylpolyglutamate synthase